MKKPDVFIYDTTLRDGTQGEGVSFSVSSKLKVTELLDEFGADYIEGGWPGSNPRDMNYFEEVRSLDLKHAKVTAFGSTRRANKSVEEDPQVQLLLDAQTPAVAIFGKSWLLHVTDVIRTTPEENLAMIEDTVRYLTEQGREVIYDAEHFFDGAIDNEEYAISTLAAAVRGGAKFITLCDTNGGMLVHKCQELTQKVVETFPDVGVGMHTHNDGGLGVALALSGVEVGATMIQGTMNGYGERTGNANIISCIANLALKMEKTLSCSDKLSGLTTLSRKVDDLCNLIPATFQPFVGRSAFAHKGGVHANAAKKVSRSYEHIEPELVGNSQRILLSDMAGASSVVMKAKELGLELEEKTSEMRAFIDLLKQKEFEGYEYENADASFEVLLQKHFNAQADLFKLISYRVITEVARGSDQIVSEATVKLEINGNFFHTVAEAMGPVGALDHAMRKGLSSEYPVINDVKLIDYKVRILERGQGTDSIVQVLVLSGDGVDSWWTTGAGENIIEASWEALRDSQLYKLIRTNIK